MADRYDAIVVGSGPNGLAAAITLAERGRSVLVVEEQDRLGGGLRCEELTLPGFRHDVFSAVHPAAAASPVFARWPLERHGLAWVQPEIAVAHPFIDGRAVVLQQGLERTRASLNAAAPGDGDRWAAFVTPYLRSFDALAATMLGGFPPLAGALRLLARLRVPGAFELARIVLMSASDLADELFASDEAAAWLLGASLHGDVPPDSSGSAIMGVYLHLLGHRVGYPSPRGGAAALASALGGYLQSLGGVTRTAARAERIVVRGDVCGVQVAGELLSTRCLLCDVTPHGLLALAGDALPEAYRRALLRYRYGPGVVKVDWALRGPIPWTAASARRAGTVHVGGGSAALRSFTTSLGGATLHPEPFVLLGQQSIADPTRAPAGCHTAWGYARVPRAAELHDDGVRQAELIEAQVERFAPGFREAILARHVLTPSGLERRNRNIRGGDVGAGSCTLDQLVFRPVPGLSPYRTPIRGLYLASAATFPGGAVHGVCGHAAARRALRDARGRARC